MANERDDRYVPRSSSSNRQDLIKPETRILTFLEKKAKLGREEAVQIEGQWRDFLESHVAIEDGRYRAGQILENIRTKLLEERTWVQFLKEVRFPRTTANAYIQQVKVVEKTIPSAA